MARDRNDSRSESLAGAASEQVRAIVAAAEATAAQIREEAEEEAKRIRGDALGEAKAATSRAAAQAGERVTRVSESAVAMLGRIEAIDRELSALLDSLRTGATRLSADLTVLQAEFADARQAAPAEPEPEPEAEAEEDEGVELAQDAAVELDDGAVPEPEPKAVGSAKPAAAANGDLEGARLIALNMALSGTSRDEVDSYLTENFDLANQAALLDEVYTSLGG
jgi:cell division septum initiation protein DivIVA